MFQSCALALSLCILKRVLQVILRCSYRAHAPQLKFHIHFTLSPQPDSICNLCL